MIYDFVFIGLGASNSLILLALIQKGLLKNKNVAVFENESKNKNDKTYCFWSGSDEPMTSDLSEIISHQFETIKVSQGNSQNIKSQPYHYIRSIDLYQHTLQKLIQEDIQIYRLAVKEITFKNELYYVQTLSDNYKAQYIFDSRPPSLANVDKKQVYINQSFYGLHIKCEKVAFQHNTFEMMNFNVDQSEYTQFVYVIPFSSTEALVEITRFGKEIIPTNYALEILNNFISKEFGKFEVVADEVGCIPMTTFLHPPNPLKGVLHTGASANLIKPSTGYGFKNMHAFAQIVSKRMEANALEKFNKITFESKARFKFYDKLLLLILLHWPSKGKLIFTRLFEKQSVLTVFCFLDEKSSIIQELKIFSSLPIFTFLKALYLHLKRENYLRYFCALLTVFNYLFLSAWNFKIANYFSYSVLIIGLLTIGIPHGALDYLLSKNKNSHLVPFILKYLFVILSYYILWIFFPTVALIVFILYSSFHFGESELMQTKAKIELFRGYFKAFLLGFSILMFIIFTHLEESLRIINNFLYITKIPFSDSSLTIISSITIALSFFYILVQSILTKSWSFFGLIFLLLIGLGVPLFLAFGFYFVFQHSSNAWQHLQIGLKMNSLQLYKKSAIYTLASLCIFILFLFQSEKMVNMEMFYANFFVFIACISLPHFLLMHIFYKTLPLKYE